MSSVPARLAIAAAALLLLDACALHGGGELRAPAPIDIAVPDLDTTPAAPTTSYVVAAPSYALVTSSEISRDAAVTALRTTEGAFIALFGSRPPRIGVVIYDSSDHRALHPLVMPPSDLATITMLGGGLRGPTSARAAASLGGDLRLSAAAAWIGMYADVWNAALEHEGIVFQTPAGEPIPRARELPGWLHVGALSLLTRSTPERESHDWTTQAIPLAALFEHRLTDREVDEVVQHREPTLFTAEAASVLHYLRDTEGETAIANLVGESVAGLDMRDILAHLPSPTTPEQLEVGWRRWASASAPSAHTSVQATPEVAR